MGHLLRREAAFDGDPFACLYPKLLDGYLLDGLEHLRAEAGEPRSAC